MRMAWTSTPTRSPMWWRKASAIRTSFSFGAPRCGSGIRHQRRRRTVRQAGSAQSLGLRLAAALPASAVPLACRHSVADDPCAETGRLLTGRRRCARCVSCRAESPRPAAAEFRLTAHSGPELGRSRIERQFRAHQVGEVAHRHLLHHMVAVDFHRSLADA